MTTNFNSASATLTIKPHGRFDFRVQQDFRQAYEPQLSTTKKFVVDLGGVSYLDSSALGMLLVLKKDAEGHGSSVELRGAQDAVARILEVSNFGSLFPTA